MFKTVLEGSGPHTSSPTDARPHHFDAVAIREGRWWIITVPALDAVTQARRVRQINDMTIGLISALLDLNEEQIEVTVALEMPGAAAAAWSEASVLHEEALAAERTAASLRRRAVHNLTADHGLTQAEAALLLKISPQRVQQLVGSASAAGAPQ